MTEKYQGEDRQSLIKRGINPDADKGFYEVDFQVYAIKNWAGINPNTIDMNNPQDVQRLSMAVKKAMLSFGLPEDVRKFFSSMTGWD